MKTFSDRLQHLMLTHKVTQQQTADACGMTHVGIGRICRTPHAECRASNALNLSRFFGCDLVWLISGETAKEPLTDNLRTLADLATQTEA